MRHSTTVLLAGLALMMSAYPAASFAGGGEVDLSRQDNIVELSSVGHALSQDDLGMQTGRQDTSLPVQLSTSKQLAGIGGNVLNSDLTGANSVSGNAFSNMNGLATIIQNSGNQVLIQNSTILNVMMK